MADVPGLNTPVIPTLIIVAGGYLAWFGVHYWRDVKQTYPTGPVKSVLTGKGVPAAVREDSPQDPNKAQGFAAILGQSAAIAAGSVGAGVNSGGAATPAGGVFSNQQLQNLWISNGGDPRQAGYAAGVAEAESGGNPTLPGSWNPDGGKNYGIWQLDTKGVGSGYPISELQDPNKSTQITVMATRNGTDWADWEDAYTIAHGHHGALG